MIPNYSNLTEIACFSCTGFQPSGAHLPVGPPTPAHVLRLLEWNAAHPEQNDEQHYNKPSVVPGRFNVPVTHAAVHYNTPVHHAQPFNAYRQHKF